MKEGKKIKLTYNAALMLICVVLFLIFGAVNPAFFTAAYIVEVIKMTVEIGIMTLPLTLLIIMGCIDFSMTSTLVLSAVAGGIVSMHTSPFVGMLTAFAVGILCGGFNGFMVAKLKLPPLISTLATMYLYKGIAEGVTLGTSVGTNVTATDIAVFLGAGKILGISTQIWIFIILAFAFHWILSKTPYGRSLYAIGLNEGATRFCGIQTTRLKFWTYVLGGLVFAIAGLVFMGRFSTIQFDSADPYLMQIIIAAVLGGADMNGGRGNIKGSVLGVCIIGILKGGMNVVLLPQTQQKIILGIILLISLIAFEIIGRREKKVKIVDKIIRRN